MNRKKDRKTERLNQIIEFIKNLVSTINTNRNKRTISMILVINIIRIREDLGLLIKNFVIKIRTKNIDMNVDHAQKFINLKTNSIKDIFKMIIKE